MYALTVGSGSGLPSRALLVGLIKACSVVSMKSKNTCSCAVARRGTRWGVVRGRRDEGGGEWSRVRRGVDEIEEHVQLSGGAAGHGEQGRGWRDAGGGRHSYKEACSCRHGSDEHA